MSVKLLPQRAAVHLDPDALDSRQQHLVLRRPGQHQVEQAAVVLAGIVERNRPLLLFDNLLEVVDICAGGHLRGESGNVTLQQLARLQDFKWPNVAAQHLLFLTVAFLRNTHHVHAGALANINRPL